MSISFHKYYKRIFLKHKKLRQRSLSVILYTFNNFSAPVFNFLLSVIIVERISLNFWGEYVSITLIVNLTVIVLAWGNKEYLLRVFSRNPSQIAVQWQTSMVQRFVLCVLLTASFFLFFSYSHYRILLLIFCIVSLFLYKSLEVLVLYKRAFLFSFILEISGYALILIAVFFCSIEKLTIEMLLLLLAGVSFFKLLTSLFYFHNDIFPVRKSIITLSLKDNTLFLSIPFFLPTLIGMLQGKMDLYCAAYFLSSDQVGKYQVYMNLLTIPHALTVFTIMPFIKNVYRLPVISLKKITSNVTLLGFIIPLPAIVIIYFIVQQYYHFQFSLLMYGLGYLQLIPYFIYFLKIQLLFRYNRQNIVVWITLATAILSFLLSIFLIPHLNIEGAIIANTITQWITLLLFVYSDRKVRTDE